MVPGTVDVDGAWEPVGVVPPRTPTGTWTEFLYSTKEEVGE